MAGNAFTPGTAAVSEKALRDLAKNALKVLPDFAAEQPTSGVKELHNIITPVLETADLPDLEPSHRAAASNALCAIIDKCQASSVDYIRDAILDDSIWLRLFNIYLQRSEDAKGKSMRQMLLALTNVITKDPTQWAFALRKQATTTFLDIICQRQDRIKVKPALQGLAHFLLRDVVSNAQLIEACGVLHRRSSSTRSNVASSQVVLKAFLAWIVHHDTALSAGHLVKNFLLQARHLPDYRVRANDGPMLPLWVEPVVQTLHEWPDRIQEFKTHVFPYCFLPNVDEFLQFLAYLHFAKHVQPIGALPDSFRSSMQYENGLDAPEEFRILLAAIETGKELTILRDNDSRVCKTIEVRDGAIFLPDNIFGGWMSHSEPEVRLAGTFLSVYSTSVTKSIFGGVFRSLKRNIVHLHTETDANFRREVHGYTQKLFDRLRASTATLSKSRFKFETSHHSRLAIPKECFRQDIAALNHWQQDSLIEALSFVAWYLRFLEWEMRSTATYQRRITALRSLTIILRSGVDPGVPQSHLSKSAQGQLNWAHGVQIANAKMIRVLFDLILDPFDDIRDAAISVLQLCLIALPQAKKHAVLAKVPRFIFRAESTMLQTGRADQADGVARAYGLMFSLASEGPIDMGSTLFSSKLGLFKHLKGQLEDTLVVAHNNLSEAVNGRPVHGTFAALRYIVDQHSFYLLLSNATSKAFENWRQLLKEIVTSTESLWSCVHHVLCSDAPEGHVPEELEEEASLDTKEILSYSWRALKEASLLLRAIITKAPIGHGDHTLITPEKFESLGRLCFTQLLELRHRGAFSTVSQTFTAFCRRCMSSDLAALRALPEAWYQQTLRSIQDKAAAITRRSAGIPALMTGILAAEPQSGGNLFSHAMNDLIVLASLEAQSANIEESRLPQVHALNCIKEIFTTSRLSVASEAYIGQGLELAAKTLNSNIWPIRNCSLMLFKALIERLLGSDEAQDWKDHERTKTSRFSYDNYPSLVQILSDLLDPNGPLSESIEDAPNSSSPLDLHGAEGVFPGLQILRQARPPETNLGPLLASVEKLLASPHWHLRDMAARTMVSLQYAHQLPGAAFSLLSTVPRSYNRQHGFLLVVKYMFKKQFHAAELPLQDLDHLMRELSDVARQWYIENNCPFVRSAFLDVVGTCGMAMLRRQDTFSSIQAWEDLVASVLIGPQYALGVSDGHGDVLLKVSLAQATIIDRVIVRDSSLGSAVLDKQQSIGDVLLLLATNDSDTCSAVLETLETLISLKPSRMLTIPFSLVLIHIHRTVLEAADPEVISKAQAILADGLTDNKLRTDFFGLLSNDQVLSSLTKLEAQCLGGPPSSRQSSLYLLGFFLDFAFHVNPNHLPSLLKAIAHYILLLRMTIVDTNPFDTRFAAVQSISALDYIWTASATSKATAPVLLGLSLVMYDLLNDDDDEIRDHAASATAKLLRAQGDPDFKNTVPILTAYRLAKYLSTTFSTSPQLVKEAIRRLTSTPSPIPFFSIPFSHAFARESHIDTALFATEKQNLYKDDSLDAVLWSRILSRQPPSLIPPNLQRRLRTWVMDGLAVLTETARKEVDGALGWSSKPEVFTLGIRVICAAEVVLRWASKGSDDGEVVRGEVVKALWKFADAGEQAEVHALWLERIERVLEKEVLGVLRRVGECLKAIGV